MKYPLIIFDWDGTLSDSTGRIVDCIHYAARQTGLPPVTDDQARHIIGLGLTEALEALWPGVESHHIASMRDAYADHFVSGSQIQMSFFEGVVALLDDLKSSRHLAVATGKSRRGLDRILSELDVEHHFHITRCADETRSKPHPLMLEEILAETGYSAHQALMIGDTSYDLDMATAAGVDGLAVTYGAHSEEHLSACRPVGVCRSITELRNWIENNG